MLLAAREVIQESLGFSPNDLVFGHKVRGPLSLLLENMNDSKPHVNLLDYVKDFDVGCIWLVNWLMKIWRKHNLRMKTWFDLQSENCEFSSVDKVLVLLPVMVSSFLDRFTGH